MALIQDGNNTSGFANVDSQFAASARLLPVPTNHYRAAFKTTSLAFTNGVNIVTLRNPAATLAVISQLTAKYKAMAITTPAATGLEVALSWFVGRTWTTLGTTNRTALVLTGNNQKMRATMGTSGLEIGFASAVGGITGDTVTQDANAIAIDSGSPQNHSVTAAATPGAGQQDTYSCCAAFQADQGRGEYPLTLAQNEGVRLVFNVTTAAAGIIAVNIVWAEVATYPKV